MEEKEPIKIKLSTVIIVFIFIILIAIVGYLAYKNNELRNKQIKSANDTNISQGNIENTNSNTENKNSNETIYNKEASNEENIDKRAYNSNNKVIDQYKEITKELDEDEVLYITEVENNNGKYIIRGVIGNEYFSENEMKEIINKGKVKVDDEVLKIEKIELEKDEEEYQLPYILKNSQGAICGFNKDGSKYHISKMSETSTAWKNTNQYRTIILDSDCAVIIEDYFEDIETSLKKEFKDFKQKDIDDVGEIFAWSNNLYRFEFKNGKCIKVIRVLTAGL